MTASDAVIPFFHARLAYRRASLSEPSRLLREPGGNRGGRPESLAAGAP